MANVDDLNTAVASLRGDVDLLAEEVASIVPGAQPDLGPAVDGVNSADQKVKDATQALKDKFPS